MLRTVLITKIDAKDNVIFVEEGGGIGSKDFVESNDSKLLILVCMMVR